jgi:hypothetical protein
LPGIIGLQSPSGVAGLTLQHLLAIFPSLLSHSCSPNYIFFHFHGKLLALESFSFSGSSFVKQTNNNRKAKKKRKGNQKKRTRKRDGL